MLRHLAGWSSTTSQLPLLVRHNNSVNTTVLQRALSFPSAFTRVLSSPSVPAAAPDPSSATESTFHALHFPPGVTSSNSPSSFTVIYFYLFIYFWLRWVIVAARGLSLVAASGGYSSLRCADFSLPWLLLLWSTGSRRTYFSSCGTPAQ